MPSDEISAEVVLYSRTKKSIKDNEKITSENVNDYRPSEETMEEANRILKRYGFRTAGYGVVGFTITGTADLYERTFDIRLLKRKMRQAVGLEPGGNVHRELEYYTYEGMLTIPEELKNIVEDVFFQPPPDFV